MAGRFFIGLGIGYVLGTKAGRERYDQLVRLYDNLSSSPKVGELTQKARESIPKDLKGVPGIGSIYEKSRANREQTAPVATNE